MPDATAAAPAPPKEAPAPKPKEKAKKPPNLDLRKAGSRIEKQDAEEAKAQESEPDQGDEQEEEKPEVVTPATGGSSSLDLWNPSPMQNFVLGAGLIGLNFFSQTSLPDMFSRVWTAPKSAADAQKQVKFGPSSLLTVAGEGVFVLILSFLTGLSPTMARAITLFYLALYLVWITFNGQKLVGIRAALDAAGKATQINTTGTSGTSGTGFIGGPKK